MSPRPAAPKGARTAVRSTEVTSDPRPAAPKGARTAVRSTEQPSLLSSPYAV
jgi:hypothetical protein